MVETDGMDCVDCVDKGPIHFSYRRSILDDRKVKALGREGRAARSVRRAPARLQQVALLLFEVGLFRAGRSDWLRG